MIQYWRPLKLMMLMSLRNLEIWSEEFGEGTYTRFIFSEQLNFIKKKIVIKFLENSDFIHLSENDLLIWYLFFGSSAMSLLFLRISCTISNMSHHKISYVHRFFNLFSLKILVKSSVLIMECNHSLHYYLVFYLLFRNLVELL